jgi:hypothetical protein
VEWNEGTDTDELEITHELYAWAMCDEKELKIPL